MTTRLFLIRHGITNWNKQRRYCGCKDVPLSQEGKLQAKKLSTGFLALNPDAIYSSDRKRALQTARLIFGQRKTTAIKNLREIDFGVLEGLRHEEILKRYGQAYKKWLDNPYKARIPQAETISAFKKRVNKALKMIMLANRGKDVAVVCHGGVIGIHVSSLLKSCDFWRYVPSAASVTIIEYHNDRPRLKKFNLKNI